MTKIRFDQLPLSKTMLSALKKKGYTHPTDIQARSIPVVIKGKDLMGIAQTGTGKTAAFSIPTIERVAKIPKSKHIKALIVTPTRELAGQIADNIRAYSHGTHLKHTVIYGGVKPFHQIRALKRGVDILVATPGRLLDLIQQGYIKLERVSVFIMDEADRMLDMGFIHDIHKIQNYLPEKRQTLMFSATMPPAITKLASQFLTDPERVEVAAVSSAAETVTQALYLVDKQNKRALLSHVLSQPEVDKALVFTRTKYGADKLVKYIRSTGISAEAIHGDKSQASRQRALRNFKTDRTNILVATDIAARGIDIKELPHVINFEIPNEPETYVHRIGRTGRARATGTALSFCDHTEKKHLKSILQLIKRDIPLVQDHPYAIDIQAELANHAKNPPRRSPRRRQRGRRRHF